MIQMRTLLNAADNSGARSLMCIKVLGGSKRRYATVGDVIKVSIRDAIPRGKVKKGEVYYNYDTNRVTFRDDLSGVAQPSFVDPHGVGFNTLLQARF